jgi:hypothetical protein
MVNRIGEVWGEGGVEDDRDVDEDEDSLRGCRNVEVDVDIEEVVGVVHRHLQQQENQ